MMAPQTEKMALFIDGANLYATAKALGFYIDYTKNCSGGAYKAGGGQCREPGDGWVATGPGVTPGFRRTKSAPVPRRCYPGAEPGKRSAA